MSDIKAEMVGGRVYFSAADIISLCVDSISSKGTPFDFALKNLASQLYNMETEAREKLEKKVEKSIPETEEFIPTFI
jgi:hypothetical protein